MFLNENLLGECDFKERMGKMKAQRKLKDVNEYAVSEVIGIILLVAITVAVAATVYVYVSSMVGQDTQSIPKVGMTAAPVSGTERCAITIATTSSPTIAWATAVVANLNCLTNATKMAAADVTLPTTGMIAGGDVISCTSLTAGNQYSLSLTYKATGSTIGTVTWIQI
jgi:FlaG/FlaF family flagellin (archaellin)